MIHFFGNQNSTIYAVQATKELSTTTISKLIWLFSNPELDSGAPKIEQASIDAFFVGPRAAMITPWSTNAVEITQNMGIKGIIRIEEFNAISEDFKDFDPMISEKYQSLNQSIFTINIKPEAILNIEDIAAYNEQEGLSLNDEEVEYLEGVSNKIGRPLTDSEVFGFSQVNSEHCRHKIFNGTFVIDGVEKETSLFKLIKETSKQNPNTIVSAYKDNVAFIKGPFVEQFAPKRADVPDYYTKKDFESVISLQP
jgi:phosphoribosylformylglycinamidine synthase